MTLWAAVVAERLGFDRDEALTLAKAVAGLNAQAKGLRLGIFEPGAKKSVQARWISTASGRWRTLSRCEGVRRPPLPMQLACLVDVPKVG